LRNDGADIRANFWAVFESFRCDRVEVSQKSDTSTRFLKKSLRFSSGQSKMKMSGADGEQPNGKNEQIVRFHRTAQHCGK